MAPPKVKVWIRIWFCNASMINPPPWEIWLSFYWKKWKCQSLSTRFALFPLLHLALAYKSFSPHSSVFSCSWFQLHGSCGKDLDLFSWEHKRLFSTLHRCRESSQSIVLDNSLFVIKKQGKPEEEEEEEEWTVLQQGCEVLEPFTTCSSIGAGAARIQKTN